MKPQGNQQEEQREREQINESGGEHRTPDPGPQKTKIIYDAKRIQRELS